MSPLSIHLPSAASAPAQPELSHAALRRRVSALYALAQTNPFVFASPLGPDLHRARPVWMPRFVFFGPHASDDSWRLSFLAGFDLRDLRPTHALLDLIETVAADAENGHGLNLTFFPLVDAAGLSATGRNRLDRENWHRSPEPEIALLARDARTRGYHGFVRLESGVEDVVTVAVRTPEGFIPTAPDVELIASDIFGDLDVRFERLSHRDPGGTPLDLAEDLGVQPFELVLRLPVTWTLDRYEAAATQILLGFIHHYRAFQAYGGHL